MAAAIALIVQDAAAAELATPVQDPILTVDGAILASNLPDGAAAFDRRMIEAFDVIEIVTQTPWTEGDVRFEGVLVRDLLAALGADGTMVRAVAINDYAVDIPISDFEAFDVILAFRMNGAPMRVRDKGPLWIIYPWSDKPGLRNEVHHGRAIWQLKRLTVR